MQDLVYNEVDKLRLSRDVRVTGHLIHDVVRHNHLYVCMYVCMYVCTVCMYVRYVCMYVLYVCTVCMYVCMYASLLQVNDIPANSTSYTYIHT